MPDRRSKKGLLTPRSEISPASTAILALTLFAFAFHAVVPTGYMLALTFFLPSYTRLDTAATDRFGPFGHKATAQLNIRNILDERITSRPTKARMLGLVMAFIQERREPFAAAYALSFNRDTC